MTQLHTHPLNPIQLQCTRTITIATLINKLAKLGRCDSWDKHQSSANISENMKVLSSDFTHSRGKVGTLITDLYALLSLLCI